LNKSVTFKSVVMLLTENYLN